MTRREDPEYRYVLPMRQAFEAAKVTPKTNPKLVKRVLRVMKRHAQRRTA